MTLRTAHVGVGKWSRVLQKSLASVGCTCVGYERGNPSAPVAAGFGRPMRWQDMVGDEHVDALVLCAPPDKTTEVALTCAAAGKPCIATKPLMLEQVPPITAPLYVDFWRLWSNSWLQFKREALARKDSHLEVAFFGAGPMREFPGTLDYGPHVMAYLLELGSDLGSWTSTFEPCGQGELLQVAGRNGRTWAARFGNGAQSGVRWLSLANGGPTLSEEPLAIQCTGQPEERKDEVLRAMCRSFVADVVEGFADQRLLRLSCEGMHHLRAMRELARKVGEN